MTRLRLILAALVAVAAVVVVLLSRPASQPSPSAQSEAASASFDATATPEPLAEAGPTPLPHETPVSVADPVGAVTWLGPSLDAVVSGDITLEVKPTPTTKRVRFQLVGRSWSQNLVDARRWAVLLDTTALDDGAYSIQATAFDASDRVLGSARTSVVVQNANPQAAVVRSQPGDDWYLPAGIKPVERSGIYGYGQINDVMTIQTWMVTWAELQTGRDRFNWEPLDRRLSQGPVVLRLKCGTPAHVPEFVQRRHPDWATFRNTDGEVELPQWSRGWVDEWESFIDAFGKRYRDNPNFVGLQLQITASGEPFMIQANARSFERLGMTPGVIREFLLRYQGDTLDAFSGYEWKVFSVVRPDFLGNYSGAFSVEQYSQAVRDATLPMLARGMGIRGSGTGEQFEHQLPWPEWSEFRSGEIVTHDDSFIPLLLHSHLDAQLENWFGSNKNGRVTTGDLDKIRHALRKSLLRALVDQYSYLWIDSDDLDLVGMDLGRYVQLNLGRRPDDAPDALLVLGEFDPIWAMPRWLTLTNLAETDRGKYMDTWGLGFVDDSDYIGRTFERDLQLLVDDRFLPPSTPHDVEVSVTYWDDASSWHLEYTRDGTTTAAPTIQGQDTQQWRTVTVRLPAAEFNSQLDGGSDLRLVADGGKVTVQVVRVIR